MRLLHEIAVFQTVKSNVIFSLFETVRLSVSISLRNLYNSLNSIKENRIILSVNFQSHVCTRRGPQNRWANTELLVAVAIFLMSGKSEKKKKKKKEKKKKIRRRHLNLTEILFTGTLIHNKNITCAIIVAFAVRLRLF